MQRPEIREVGLGVKLGELGDGPVPRFVGRLSGERKVANLCRGNSRLQFLVHHVEQVGCLAATGWAKDLVDVSHPIHRPTCRLARPARGCVLLRKHLQCCTQYIPALPLRTYRTPSGCF